MTRTPTAHPFANLVAADRLASFMTDDFERRPVFLGPAANADHGFDLRTFFETLRDTVWPEKAINFVPNGKHTTCPELKSKMLSSDLRFTLDRIRAARAMKATIMTIQFQRFHQGLRDLMNSINASGFYNAKANVYFTPAGAQGFLPHWDRHDVFVLQISGEKEWHISKETDCLHPTENDHFTVYSGFELGEKTVTTLKQGELLYVPRGFGHYAKALDSDSLHVTIGMSSIYWNNVVKSLLQKMVFETPTLRTSVTHDGHGLDPSTVDCSGVLEHLHGITAEQLQDIIRDQIATRRKEENTLMGQMMGKDIDDLMG